MNIKMLKSAVAGLVLSVSGFANAGLITHEGNDWTESLTPPFGALTTSVDDFFIDYGVDYTFGNSEGVFSDPPNGLCGINANGVCDLLTAVDGQIVDLGTTNQSFTSFISVTAGNAAQGTLLLEAFDISMNLLGTVVNGSSGVSSFSIDRSGVFDIAFFRVSGNDTWGLQVVSIESPMSEIPEPTTLAIFALGLMGLASRRFKKQ